MGGSLGGMQALAWAIRYPQRIARALVIAAAPNLSAQNIAFNEVARAAIMTDPEFHDGQVLRSRRQAGTRLARRAHDRAHHLYLRRADGGAIRPPAAAMASTSRSRRSSRSSRICAIRAKSSPSITTRTRTCASPRRSTISIPRLATGGDLARALAPATCKFPGRSRSPPTGAFRRARSREIVKALVDNRSDVCYAEIDAPHGHDAFLLDTPQYHAIVRAFLNRAAP